MCIAGGVRSGLSVALVSDLQPKTTTPHRVQGERMTPMGMGRDPRRSHTVESILIWTYVCCL